MLPAACRRSQGMMVGMQCILYQSPWDWAGGSIKPKFVAWQQLASSCRWRPF